jgi:signal transduction histidine kinase
MPRRLYAWANGLRQRLSVNNQQQFFAYFALTVAFVAGVITALTSPFPMVVQANIAAPICWASLMVGLYLGLSTKMVCLIGTSFASIQLCVVAWYSGGIYSSALAWMAVLVMANYFIVGPRVALGFLAVCIAGHALMVSADWLIGIAPEIQSVSLRESGTSLLDNSLVYVVMTLVTLLYRQSDIRIWKDLRARQLDLQEQRAKLERTMAARDQFIAAINHEVKNPLRAIADMSEALLADAEHPPDVCMVLEHSSASALQASAAVTDLLDYTRLQSGQLQVRIEALQLPVELHAAYATLQAQKKSPGVRCALEIDSALLAPLHSDKALLALCLQKLLDNACRFTQSGHITLAAHRSGNDAVILSVEDSGVGMSPLEQDRLNHTLQDNAPTLRQGQQSAGLGLLVAQGVVQLLGGTLGFESAPYRGTRFWIRLPLQNHAPLSSARSIQKA